MRPFSVLMLLLAAACVPAAVSTPASPTTLAKVEAVAQSGGFALAFPPPLPGWSSGPTVERAGPESGATTLERSYSSATDGSATVTWLLDAPAAAAAVLAAAPPNPKGRSILTRMPSGTLEIAVDARTVVRIAGAGLATNVRYHVAMIAPTTASQP